MLPGLDRMTPHQACSKKAQNRYRVNAVIPRAHGLPSHPDGGPWILSLSPGSISPVLPWAWDGNVGCPGSAVDPPLSAGAGPTFGGVGAIR
jgi:hypothetical protein